MPLFEANPYPPVGNLALAIKAALPVSLLRRTTYAGGSSEREIIKEEAGLRKVERHLPAAYRPPEEAGVLGHVAFALKHEVPHLGLLTATFRRVQPAEVGAYIAASPTGAYARRIGYFYEMLTGHDLTPFLQGVTIGGNYADLLDPAKLVTAEPRRNGRWRVLDNLPGTRTYAPLIERTAAAEAALRNDWGAETSAALSVGAGDDSLIRRALNYLYLKETRSSFAIERETPSEARAARFVEALKQAGGGSTAEALSETNLSALQNLIVDERFAERGFRKIQNYVAATVRWRTVIHYVPPPPQPLTGLMAGWSEAISRLEAAAPLAQATVASFGFVFHHPFEDGNGRLHRYLLHDFMARRRVIPGGMALPVSAAILADMRGYDDALEAYSKTVEALVAYEMNGQDEMTVTNFNAIDWVWRYPDLTPQVEYLGQVLRRSVDLVAEEVAYLSQYDALEKKARTIIDMPDQRLSALLTCIHENGGKLSNNRRKQRFTELTDQEILALETAYAEAFSPAAETPAEQPPPDHDADHAPPARR
jgi:hypothetical protein